MGVVEGLPQGPTPIMLLRRGVVRHTYHMSVDVRVAYTYVVAPVEGLSLTASAEVMNVLGSATEQLEDPRTGATFRQPLETVPGRAGFLRLTLGWN